MAELAASSAAELTRNPVESCAIDFDKPMLLEVNACCAFSASIFVLKLGMSRLLAKRCAA
jgi:hypothetical protein